MDPITLIVGALVAGAVAGLKPTAEQAVKDAYAGLKTLIQRKYATVNVAALEEEPNSKVQKAAVEDTLKKKGAGQDAELLAEAEKVIELVKRRDPETARTYGLDLRDSENAQVKQEDLSVSGNATGIHAPGSKGFRYEGKTTRVGDAPSNEDPSSR